MPNKYKIPSSTKIQNWYQRNLEPYFTYYRRVFKYAWTQTKQTYLKVGWKSRVGFIVFNLIVVAIVLVLRGREEMIQEMSVFISILIAFGIVALATLIWNILIAPARLHFNLKRKVRTTAFQQYQDAQELIRKEHISIDLSMDDGLPFEEEYESNSERKIIYRVGVTDVGLDSIQSAGVILESMTSIDKWGNRTEMVILSVNLRVMGSSEKTVRIDPSTRPRRFFDVME